MNNTTAQKTGITNLGILSDEPWPGSISARKMQSEGIFSIDKQREIEIKLNEYFVIEDADSDARCIDGRCDSHLSEEHLGAQVPGGTPGAALAYRLALLVSDIDVGNFTDDAHDMLQKVMSLGFKPGDHRDTHGKGIGCGAIDKMDLALAAMLDPKLIAAHKQLVKKLLGDNFDDATYMQIVGAGTVLEARIDEYMQKREESIVELETAIHHPVSILEGDHRECFVIINLVPKTTFATKRFSDAFGGVQAFNYDVWRTFELADAMFPANTETSQRNSFIMARVMTAVATLMVLTDGSQLLLVRGDA